MFFHLRIFALANPQLYSAPQDTLSWLGHGLVLQDFGRNADRLSTEVYYSLGCEALLSWANLIGVSQTWNSGLVVLILTVGS